MKFSYQVGCSPANARQGHSFRAMLTRRGGGESQFSNLCGSVYKGGNLVFTPDGTSVLSPVGNRITVFDLTGCVARPGARGWRTWP